MAEHMLNALLERLNQLKAEYADNQEELTCTQIAVQVFGVMKNYTLDRRNILNLFGQQNLSPSDVVAMQELDYE